MKRKLLFVVSPRLGESLFATPTIDVLSNEYDVYVYCVKNLEPIFRKYSFIKDVIPYPYSIARKAIDIENNVEIMARLTKCFDHPQLIRSYIAWQDDQDAIDISSDSKYLQFFEILPMESSLVLYTKHISRTRKIFLKLKLATEEKLDFFDLRIRRLGYNKKQSTGTIVVNQGAFSDLRRLTDRTLINLAKKIPNAVFILHKETAERNFFKGTNIKYLISEPGTEKTLLNVISLFESSPRCIITPDTGLAHLATAYEIPMIWLESWVDNRKVLEPQSMNNIKIYKKHNLTCLKNCNAKLRTENWIHPDTLECNFEIVSCLDLDKNNIEELLRLIP